MHFSHNNIIKAILGLLIAVILFHVCVIVKLIPYQIAWGGRLTDDKSMYLFETISIVINLFICWILLMKADWVRYKFSAKVLNGICWVLLALFVLNTIGNLVAKTLVEQCFAILTALLAFAFWKLLRFNNGRS